MVQTKQLPQQQRNPLGRIIQPLPGQLLSQNDMDIKKSEAIWIQRWRTQIMMRKGRMMVEKNWKRRNTEWDSEETPQNHGLLIPGFKKVVCRSARLELRKQTVAAIPVQDKIKNGELLKVLRARGKRFWMKRDSNWRRGGDWRKKKVLGNWI